MHCLRWSVSQPWRGPHFCLFGCVDDAGEEAAVKDMQKRKVWNEDLGKSPYAKSSGPELLLSMPSHWELCRQEKQGWALEEGGGHWSWPLTAD